jgi:D-alanyl-D-alanine dipeptidase
MNSRARYWIVISCAIAVSCGSPGTPESPVVDRAALASEGLVPLRDADPRLRFDIRYATERNFTGKVLYSSNVAMLRLSVAERLRRAHDRLVAQGYGIVVWDAYRPLSAQETMFALVNDERYVADPAKGSRHNRGAAIDVTLCDAYGRPVEMPTDYDDFSERAHRDSTQMSAAAARHYALLDAAMRGEGFVGLPTEWWHYDDPEWESYPIIGR